MLPPNSGRRHRDALLERALPGAGLLLAGCAHVDASVGEAVAAARDAGRTLACGPGCDACCRQPIPVTPLEFLLMRSHMRLRLDAATRARLEAQYEGQLAAQPDALQRPCPFLLDGGCSVYAVRPLACRRYLVLDRACAPGEVCTQSRPGDMLIPARKALHAALAMTFPWYAGRWQALGLPEPPAAEPGSEAAQAWLRSVTVPVQNLPWN
ncbi:YkgJ family cysteine cluster protein [Desulfovibrio sp.]|uniref:YkgJ family cysteine cluster protein n=1 Tax=Desulfovibrio sp. TaxID=885 RepID=UPI0023CBEC35|nr:YkgJ family cysteine cluster protein [Desulfovibrio sp.]MDE7241348.1 YkgJ family cysteine cluster protein [Desulfovibrio sp.]